MELLELEKSLVYFSTSLRSNEVVLEKLLKVDSIKKYPDDTDLLEDVIIENKQPSRWRISTVESQRHDGNLCFGYLQ